MAVLGRWTGGVQAQGNLPEVWTAPNGLFPTEQRNDASTYGWVSTTSRLTLPASGLANGYLFIGKYRYADTSNGRFNPQGRVVQSGGTGNFIGIPAGGYNRNNNNPDSYVTCWAIVDNPSASATFDFEWRADTDDALGGTDLSSFEVIPLFYNDIGMFTGADAGLLGGITPNVVALNTDVLAGTNITRSANVVTCAADNVTYLILTGQFFEGRGGRTQRWHGIDIDGVQEDSMQAYTYYRNTANDQVGNGPWGLMQTITANRTLELTCYRGDGVANGDGGADTDGSTPTVGEQGIVVLELNSAAEVWWSVDGTGAQALDAATPLDLNIARTGDIVFSDAASFVRETDIAVNCEVAMDALAFANISAASTEVTSGERGQFAGFITEDGVEDGDTEHGNYIRGNQGTIDTFGWSATPRGFIAVALDGNLGASTTQTGGDVEHATDTNANWVGFGIINLDTLSGPAGDISAATTVAFSSVADLTAQGKLDAAATLAITTVADLTARGKLDAAATLAFSTVADLKARGQLDAAATLLFSTVADLTSHKIVGATTLAFSSVADLKARGDLAAAITLLFTATGELDQPGPIDAATTLLFSTVANLVATGKLDAATALAFSSVALLTATGKLDAATTLAFSNVADLTARGKLDAAVTLIFSTVADLKAKGQLAAATTILFSIVADLKAKGQLDAATTLAFSTVADLKARGKLDAAATLAFSTVANLQATGQLDAATTLAFSTVADLTDATPTGLVAFETLQFSTVATLTALGKLDAATSLAITSTPQLTALGKLDAAAALAFSTVADLKASGKLDAAAILALATAADLTGRGRLEGASALTFGTVADLTSRGRLSSVASIAFGNVAGLTGQGKLDAIAALAFTNVATLIDASAPIYIEIDINITGGTLGIGITGVGSE